MKDRSLPRHVAIIMDGNGRWAKQHGKVRNEGHKRGAEALAKVADYANKIGIEYLTVYAFSTENWKRPKEEVKGLMDLLKFHLNKHLSDAKKKDIRFKVLGDKEGLPQDLQKKINELETITENKKGMTVNLAINYGGRDEIVRACRKMVAFLEEHADTTIDEVLLEGFLDTTGMPDPDLMIRTSGEMRTSNFLPWQLAYSEFYFTEKLWPEFDKEAFEEALLSYEQRKRRFGKSE